MRTTILLLALGSTLAATVAAQTPADSAQPTITLPPALARVLTDYETAYRTGGSALAPLFTEDGFVLPTGRPPVKGRRAIAAYYGTGGGPLSLRAIAYAVDGNVGYILGGYTRERGQPDAGKFTLTLRKSADGRWLIYSDMDNPNSRPTRPTPPDL